MNKKTFIGLASYLFLAVAILHLLRVVNGWPLVISETAIPMWASWVAVAVLGYMAWNGFSYKS